MAIDQYALWRRALAEGTPVQAGTPQPGFYRYGDDAVAYWLQDNSGLLSAQDLLSASDHLGDMRCLINGKIAGLEQAIEMWGQVMSHPVSHAEYTHRTRHGRWPSAVTNPAGNATVGHNRPPDDGSVESIASVLDAIAVEVNRILKDGPAKSQEEADHAAELADEISQVEARVTEQHKTEKAPILAASRRIDSKWRGLREKAEDLKTKIKLRVITPFIVRMRRQQDERRAAAVQSAEPFAEETVKVSSERRTMTLRKVKLARVDDWGAAITYFHSNERVREVVQGLADRAVKGGIAVPGCSVIEIEQAV